MRLFGRKVDARLVTVNSFITNVIISDTILCRSQFQVHLVQLGSHSRMRDSQLHDFLVLGSQELFHVAVHLVRVKLQLVCQFQVITNTLQLFL